MTCVGIVYGEKSGIVRSIIIPDDPRELAIHHAPGMVRGEAMIVREMADYSLVACTTEVERWRGEPSRHPHCVVVCPKTGSVLHTLMADADIDEHPDGAIEHHKKATHGWVKRDGEWLRPLSGGGVGKSEPKPDFD